MKNTFERNKIGYLVNKEHEIIIPLFEGITEITSDTFKDKLKFCENLNFIFFKINFQANEKAYLRSYEQFPLQLSFNKNNKTEDYYLCKSGIVAITSFYDLEIKILNSKISFGTFTFEKNVEIFIKKINSRRLIKEMNIEIIDLCTPYSDGLNTENSIKNNNNCEYTVNSNEKKSGCDNELINVSASESEEIVYTGDLSGSEEKLVEFSLDKSGDSRLEDNSEKSKSFKLNESSETVIYEKKFDGDSTWLSPYVINNYNIIVIPKELLQNIYQLSAERSPCVTNKNREKRNSLNMKLPKEIKSVFIDHDVIKPGYNLRNIDREKENQLKSASLSMLNKTDDKVTLLRDNPRLHVKRSRQTGASPTETDIIVNSCMICLDTVKNPSKVNTCGHLFCRECIDKWTELSNSCPLCKKDFKKIIYYKNNKVLKERIVRQKTFKIEDEDDNDAWIDQCLEYCMKCKRTDDEYLMLLCDKCHYNVCHTYCDGLDKIPEDDWLCGDCLN